MKYSATILLFAAAAFWASASARPRYREQQDVIDAVTRWAIADNEQIPEPHKTKLYNRLYEAQHQHWDDLIEYLTYLESVVARYYREAGIEWSRRKRDVDNNEIVDNDDIYNNEMFYAFYARVLVLLAPPAHQEALEEKYRKALEEDYENFDDFEVEAIKIFEEETGLDFKKIEDEYDGDEKKQSELESKFVKAFTDALKSALENDSSSEED